MYYFLNIDDTYEVKEVSEILDKTASLELEEEVEVLSDPDKKLQSVSYDINLRSNVPSRLPCSSNVLKLKRGKYLNFILFLFACFVINVQVMQTKIEFISLNYNIQLKSIIVNLTNFIFLMKKKW